MEAVSAVFAFLGGIGMFLYGMKLMGDGMQRSAGGRMTELLGVLTGNPIMAVLVGALVTAVIQSSGATTVMVIGFVSAGVMTLTQAAFVIMGANIGTSITAWIVSLSQLGSAMEFLKPSFIAPVLIGAGALICIFSKKKKRKTTGEIILGLGLLFMGLDLMSGAMAPYRDSPVFVSAFTSMGHIPPLGMLIGFLVTAIMQSSSASIGVLQMLASNGMVGFGASVFIALGANIGSTVTALISSAGGSRRARQAAAIHLLYNVFGAVLFGVIFLVLFMWKPELGEHAISPVGISIFHTVTKTINTLLLMPLVPVLVKLSGKLAKETEEEKERGREEHIVEEMKTRLDKRLLQTPFTALQIAKDEVVEMGTITLENLRRAQEAILTQDTAAIERTLRTENALDQITAALSDYLLQISERPMSDEQYELLNHLLYSVSDIERVGDREENIAEIAQKMMEDGQVFSQDAAGELRHMFEVTIDGFSNAIEARRQERTDLIRRVSQDEDEVDMLEEELRERHVARLREGRCTADTGIAFMDVIGNLERISDHAYNIAGYVKREL